MRKLVIILVALLVVAGAIYLGSQRLLVQTPADPTPSTIDMGPGRVEEVRCRGRIVPRRWLALSFAAAGQVARVAVQEGATVQRGDLLAELRSEGTGLELQAAEQRLLSARAQLAQAKATPAPEAVRASEARVAAAQAHLDALRAGPTAAELEQARLRVDQARDNLWGAQATRDSLGGDPMAGTAYTEAQARVAALEVEVRLAEIAYEQAKAGPRPADIAAAEAELAQAQADLAALKAGSSPEQLAVLQSGVAEAEVAVEQARAAQTAAGDAARLCAPFAGTVAQVTIQEGQWVNGATEAIVLADLSELEVETVDLTELDIGALRPEMPVEISIPGFGTPIVQGRVRFISPGATVAANGEVLYRVLISLDRQDPALRWGMSANLAFGRRAK